MPMDMLPTVDAADFTSRMAESIELHMLWTLAFMDETAERYDPAEMDHDAEPGQAFLDSDE